MGELPSGVGRTRHIALHRCHTRSCPLQHPAPPYPVQPHPDHLSMTQWGWFPVPVLVLRDRWWRGDEALPIGTLEGLPPLWQPHQIK